MASGNEQYIKQITKALVHLENKGIEVVIGKAARWSLTSNAMQHEKVLNICKEMIKKSDDENSFVKEQLIQIVKKVEKQKQKKG